ncbi:MAG: glucokinase [Acidobacteriota bacterium]|nr:glucokinase [Acidobacteriota bacterium]
MILAGDIGGTKTNLALFDAKGGGSHATHSPAVKYQSAKHDSLEAILAEFVTKLASSQPRVEITAACFGVAGPVVGDEVKTPNLAWTVKLAALKRALGTSRVSLINDLEATAYGIEDLSQQQYHALNEGARGGVPHRALIAAGTGLGMAGIFWNGAHYQPIASEGGHIDFAPRNETEIALLRYLQMKLGGHVSYERVVSGSGLVNIYNFLRDGQHAAEAASLAEKIGNSEDAAATISAAALSGESGLARRALEMFVEIYGAMAGNLALTLKPYGGLYVGGGIAPKILEVLKGGAFMRAFTDKGRMSSLAASFPVRVILDDQTALYGAARYAASGDSTAVTQKENISPTNARA